MKSKINQHDIQSLLKKKKVLYLIKIMNMKKSQERLYMQCNICVYMQSMKYRLSGFFRVHTFSALYARVSIL